MNSKNEHKENSDVCGHLIDWQSKSFWKMKSRREESLAVCSFCGINTNESRSKWVTWKLQEGLGWMVVYSFSLFIVKNLCFFQILGFPRVDKILRASVHLSTTAARFPTEPSQPPTILECTPGIRSVTTSSMERTKRKFIFRWVRICFYILLYLQQFSIHLGLLKIF